MMVFVLTRDRKSRDLQLSGSLLYPKWIPGTSATLMFYSKIPSEILNPIRIQTWGSQLSQACLYFHRLVMYGRISVAAKLITQRETGGILPYPP